MSMLPWVIEMIVRIVTPGIMSHPVFAVVHVRGVWVSRLITVIASVILLGLLRLATIRRGPVMGRPRSNWFVLLVLLCKDRDSQQEAKQSQAMSK
jgi:hypothetical protein